MYPALEVSLRDVTVVWTFAPVSSVDPLFSLCCRRLYRGGWEFFFHKRHHFALIGGAKWIFPIKVPSIEALTH